MKNPAVTKSAASALLVVAILWPRPAGALQIDEALSLVAMPLAVAAVSELSGVPAEPLFDLISLMNDADVPPAQFVEVVRYVPVALAEERTESRDLVQLVRARTTSGVRGDELARVITTELRETYTATDMSIDVSAPRVVYTEQELIPATVRTRLAARSNHPHGGPPGQLKKELSVKTGAEIVHGSRPADRDRDRAESGVRVERRVESRPPVIVIESAEGRGKKKMKKSSGDQGNSGNGNGKQKDHGNDGGQSKGKGKGKG